MRAAVQVLEVWGDLACFTRPELKVERFSYPVITPSAARGIFDAIYSKPNRDPTQAQFRWQITRIEVLNEPRFIALRRNELSTVQVATNSVQYAGDPPEQRQTMALSKVRYRIQAVVRPWPGFEEHQRKYESCFARRAERGQCFQQPYLGCREFPADFELVGGERPAPEKPWRGDMDIGLMVYDVFDLSSPNGPSASPCISLFHATVESGLLVVPPYESDQVLKSGKGSV